MRITRDLDAAKTYLRERYAESADARFGLVASSRDRDLERFGVPNDYQSTKRMRNGPWYGDDESAPGAAARVATFVSALRSSVLRGSSLMPCCWHGERILGASGKAGTPTWPEATGAAVRSLGDPWQLRSNAYRVLLTRARDATVVYVPTLHGSGRYIHLSGADRISDAAL